MDIPKLIEEVRKSFDFLLQLPDKIISMYQTPIINYLDRKNRIGKLKELAELREISKSIQTIFLSKGSISTLIDNAIKQRDPTLISIMRGIFEDVELGLQELMDTIGETSFSNTTLATESIVYLAKLKDYYSFAATLSDDDLLHDGVLEILGLEIESFTNQGTALMKQLDEERRCLDYSYGN